MGGVDKGGGWWTMAVIRALGDGDSNPRYRICGTSTSFTTLQFYRIYYTIPGFASYHKQALSL